MQSFRDDSTHNSDFGSFTQTKQKSPPRYAKPLYREPKQQRSPTAASTTSTIITHSTNKMSLSALHAAVIEHQAMIREQEEVVKKNTEMESERDNAGDGSDSNGDNKSPTRKHRLHSHPQDYSVHPDTDTTFLGDTYQMRSMIFLRSLKNYEEYERTLVINPTKHRKGQVEMTEEMRDELESARESSKSHAKSLVRHSERSQPSNICSSARVISFVGEETVKQPSFVVNEAEKWGSRKRLLSRFLTSVNKFITHTRVNQRLANYSAHVARTEKKDAKDAGMNAASVAIDTTKQQQQPHPLSLASITDEQSHLRVDFILHTNNVQNTTGFIRRDGVEEAWMKEEKKEVAVQMQVLDDVNEESKTEESESKVNETGSRPITSNEASLTSEPVFSSSTRTKRRLEKHKKSASSLSTANLNATATVATPATAAVPPGSPPTNQKRMSANGLNVTEAKSSSSASKSAATSTSSTILPIVKPLEPIKELPIHIPASLLGYNPIVQQHTIVSNVSLAVPIQIMNSGVIQHGTSLTTNKASPRITSNSLLTCTATSIISSSHPAATDPRDRARYLFDSPPSVNDSLDSFAANVTPDATSLTSPRTAASTTVANKKRLPTVASFSKSVMPLSKRLENVQAALKHTTAHFS